MAKKTVTIFECISCGHETPKWLGRCPSCGEWNSFKEKKQIKAEVSESSFSSGGKALSPKSSGALVLPHELSELKVEPQAKISLGQSELDRVLGGGILRGSSVLLGGEPGIGKSTLTLQAAGIVAKDFEVLYIAGEESEQQIKLRSKRLKINEKGIHLVASSHLADIAEALASVQPGFVVVDSVQTLYAPEAGSAPGSPNQIKYCVHTLSEWCRSNNAALLLIAHVTKDGIIAGPKLLEHMVDVVLYFEEAEAGLRVLRPSKNRYGSTDEIGLFRMNEVGLEEIKDPSGLLLELGADQRPPGVAITPVYEGSRILLVEIQALTVPNKAGFSRVYSDRIDQRRVSRIAAVLEKHAGLSFSDQEIYVNVAGGLKINDVGVDLALAMALFSARSNLALPPAISIMGEISLSGEVKTVSHLKRRLQAAQELGFIKALGPRSLENQESGKQSNYKEVKKLTEGIELLFGKARS